MLWFNVWVCEFDVDWVVDDEITCSRCVYMYTLCFHSKLMKYNVVVDELLMNSWLVVVVVMRCCCWLLMPWVIIIIELEVNLCCSWRFSWKMGQMVILLNWCFGSSFIWSWVSSCLETFRQTLGSNLGIGKSKLGFLGEKWWKTRKNRRKLAWSLLMASSL